ncbi:hypothetical protein CDN99_00890 [Roseateles aquatilis]|uniref:Peptidase S9 prolyl oligopeptidase catalytic domain-containing protein n=1 Tax=Roseateles aquatilis TaxID=431061 RepID=A0A246JKS0_9BURK|nr:hypothetical protein CDN99_00890 [Roseateles aquatilis]
MLLSACFGGGDDKAQTAAVIEPSEVSPCQVLKVTPEASVTDAFVDPLLTLTYTAPTAGTCNNFALVDRGQSPVPTRVVAASEWPHPQGGFVGTLTLEPVDALAQKAGYGLKQNGKTISLFTTGTERRGSLAKVEDQPVHLSPLPESARIGKDDINGVVDALAERITEGNKGLAFLLKALLKRELPHLADPQARFAARVGKLTYRSVDATGAPVTLSGLLVYPEQDGGGAPMDYNGLPIVIGQRGAGDNDSEAPSSGAHIMTVPGLLAAGKGHVYIAPDLIGMGDTAKSPQAYLMAKDTAAQTQDMLRAVREYFLQQHRAQLGRDLRIVGASQGGFSSIAPLPHLSLDGTVRLVSAAEGPYDVHRTFHSSVLAVGGAARDAYSEHEDLKFVPSHVRDVMESFQTYQGYRFDPKAVFAEDGSLLPSFLQDYKDGKYKDFVAHLGANSLASNTQQYNLPEAKVKLYHFTKDSLVPSQNTVDLLAKLSAAPNRLASVERGNCHESSEIVKLVLQFSKSSLKTHIICVPFQIDDLVGEL